VILALLRELREETRIAKLQGRGAAEDRPRIAEIEARMNELIGNHSAIQDTITKSGMVMDEVRRDLRDCFQRLGCMENRCQQVSALKIAVKSARQADRRLGNSLGEMGAAVSRLRAETAGLAGLFKGLEGKVGAVEERLRTRGSVMSEQAPERTQLETRLRTMETQAGCLEHVVTFRDEAAEGIRTLRCEIADLRIAESLATIRRELAELRNRVEASTVQPVRGAAGAPPGFLPARMERGTVLGREGLTDRFVWIRREARRIAKGAFKGCKDLESVAFEEDSRLEEIGEDAFYRCSSLKAVAIPPSVVRICDGAFVWCRGLARVDFAEDGALAVIGHRGTAAGAFQLCASLTQLRIPRSVALIGGWAFSGCSNLIDVVFAEGSRLRSIGQAAFEGTACRGVELPAGVAVGANAWPAGCIVIEA
jgi:hypothetical protein